MRFEEFFERATGWSPFGFQRQFASQLPSLVHVPTGLGKTAMVILGWLWRRLGSDGIQSTASSASRPFIQRRFRQYFIRDTDVRPAK